MSKAFEDTSIMQGVVEFVTDSGEDLRVMRESGLAKVYVKQRGAYVFERTIATDAKSPRAIFEELEAARYTEEV